MEDVAHDLFLTDQEAYDLLEELCDWGSLKRPRRKDEHNVYRTPAKNGFEEGQPRTISSNEELFFLGKGATILHVAILEALYHLARRSIHESVLGVLGVYSHLLRYGARSSEHANWRNVPLHLDSLGSHCNGVQYLGMVVSAIAALFNPATAAQPSPNQLRWWVLRLCRKAPWMRAFLNFLFFTAIISASLGLMNMLPIPRLTAADLWWKYSRRYLVR